MAQGSFSAFGLAAVGAGPLASIGAAIVGNLAKHVYAGVSSMVSSDTLNSGATSGINAVVDEFGGLVEFSQGQQDLWTNSAPEKSALSLWLPESTRWQHPDQCRCVRNQ
jgi:hypothetical protein